MNMEWISVKDRLPDDNEDVIVYDVSLAFYKTSTEFGVSTATRFNGEWLDYQGEPHKEAEYITHWMPIPKRPNLDGIDLPTFKLPYENNKV